MLTTACCLVVGLGLDLVTGWLMVVHTYLRSFPLSLSLSLSYISATWVVQQIYSSFMGIMVNAGKHVGFWCLSWLFRQISKTSSQYARNNLHTALVMVRHVPVQKKSYTILQHTKCIFPPIA